jgi:hypothetical protein
MRKYNKVNNRENPAQPFFSMPTKFGSAFLILFIIYVATSIQLAILWLIGVLADQCNASSDMSAVVRG